MKEQYGFMHEQYGSGQPGSGVQFGNYDLIRRIDVGGMGEVYLAHQRSAFGREVAVKIIRADLVHDITARKRFLREAEVSAYLKHDHILPLFEFGEEQGRLFLVTPYIKGGTLGTRLQHGAISLSEVHQLFSALLQAVSYLHKRGVIHRDLKPSNILLDHEEDNERIYVRLIDFGIATLQGMEASPPLTTAGWEVGTAAYMAPERLDGIAAPSNDIYSLGIILYQMLTGQFPESRNKVSLPLPLEQIVHHSTAPDPEQRYGNADELLQDFERAYKALTGSRLPVVTPKPQPIPNAEEAAATVVTPRSEAPLLATSHKPWESTLGLSKKSTLHSPQSLKAPEWKLSAFPSSATAFSSEDYNAPTSYGDPTQQKVQTLTNTAALPQKIIRTRQQSKHSVIAIISVCIVIITAAIGGLGFLAFESALSANITISPRVQPISGLFTLSAQPGNTNTTSATTIAAYVYSSTQSATQQGQTSGIAHCILGILDCKQAVSFNDVDTLAQQARATARSQIQQDLSKQASAAGATLVGTIVYQDTNVTANPSIGTVSKTVSVTVTEQGNVEGIKTQDVHNRAITLLQGKLSANYQLISQYTQVSQPVVQSVSATGDVQIAVAAAGVEGYQITSTTVTDIQNHIKGMSSQAAHTYMSHYTGIDPQNVLIHISYGDNIPSNTRQIKLTIAGPATVPTVQLPILPTPMATSTT